jgi:hypothetical protein
MGHENKNDDEASPKSPRPFKPYVGATLTMMVVIIAQPTCNDLAACEVLRFHMPLERFSRHSLSRCPDPCPSSAQPALQEAPDNRDAKASNIESDGGWSCF